MSVALQSSNVSPSHPAIKRQTALLLSSKQTKYLCGFLLSLLTARLAAMALFPFTDTTEARYAEIARKMLETGNWITPQFAYGVPFWGKPPLHTWLSAGGMGAFGVNEFAARLPVFFLACGLLALLYFWLRAEKGAGFALVGTSVLASSGLFFISSAVVMTDLPLVAATTLSMIAFWNAVQARTRHRLWGYLFFAGLAMGLLAKGPISIVLTGLPVGLWVILGCRWTETWRRLPWMSGTLLMVVLAAPWYLIAEQKTPGFLQYFLIGEHFERFLVTGWTGDLYGVARAQPHGMIWLIGVLGFLPWSFFFIRPLLRIRSVAARFRADASGWGSYLLLWMLSPLLIFTAANNIIVPYVLPGIPAAAVLLVQSWIDSDRTGTCIGRGSVNGFKAISAGFLATIAIAAIAFATSPEIVSTKSQKRLVAAASGIAPPDAGRLVYWQYHFFSAEFYSAGKSAQIKSFAALDALFTDRRRDFLAVRADGLRQIPQSYMSHFTQVGVFGRFHLFFENPLGGRAP